MGIILFFCCDNIAFEWIFVAKRLLQLTVFSQKCILPFLWKLNWFQFSLLVHHCTATVASLLKIDSDKVHSSCKSWNSCDYARPSPSPDTFGKSRENFWSVAVGADFITIHFLKEWMFQMLISNPPFRKFNLLLRIPKGRDVNDDGLLSLLNYTNRLI